MLRTPDWVLGGPRAARSPSRHVGPDVCRHTGVCIRGLPRVFQIREMRWIQLEHATADEIAVWRRGARNSSVSSGCVEYSRGYASDHWCEKGHILLCLEGWLETELKDGRRFTGAKLFIVD